MPKTFKTTQDARRSNEYAELKEAGKTDSEILDALVPTRTFDDDTEDTKVSNEAVPADGVSYGEGVGDEVKAEPEPDFDRRLSHDSAVPPSPAVPIDDTATKPLEEMTADELMTVAQQVDLPGRSTMDKETLLNALVNFDPDSQDSPS